MGIGTLLGFLIGRRQSILTLAAHPRAWIVGLVFVFSAAFAREYDGEDLLHEPWHLLLPLVASLAASFLLYCVLYGFSVGWRKDGPTFLSGYRSFLTLFWMTAPLAWLYAIPYKRFLDPLDAANANLATLALVAFWRVALMIRVGIVLMGLSFWTSLFRVMAYADGMALLGISMVPFPIIQMMGGISASEAEKVVHEATLAVLMFGGCSFPVWLILAGGSALEAELAGRWQIPMQSTAMPKDVSWPLRFVAFLSLAVWIGILPFTQPEQQLRREAEVAFREKRIADALAIISAHRLDDFPPGWQPPPRFLKGEDDSLTLEVWDEILTNEPAPWVRELYSEKLIAYLDSYFFRWDFDKLSDLLNRMPEEEALSVLTRTRAQFDVHTRLNLRRELREKLTPLRE